MVLQHGVTAIFGLGSGTKKSTGTKCIPGAGVIEYDYQKWDKRSTSFGVRGKALEIESLAFET